jgi:hypothetical protein
MIFDTCLLISLVIVCCLFIDKDENAGDDPGDIRYIERDKEPYLILRICLHATVPTSSF